MKVLVACEFSGVVRDAFIACGHDAVSCDLLPSEAPGPHIQANITDLFKIRRSEWDLMIAFPPCTHLAVSGARWFKNKQSEQKQAIEFFMMLARVPIEHIAIENPVGIMSSQWRKPDQIIQPWQFGHGETKATCLWLKNLPPLLPTCQDNSLFVPATPAERVARVHREPPSPERWKNRSRTYQGIADAMAEQWSDPPSHVNDEWRRRSHNLLGYCAGC